MVRAAFHRRFVALTRRAAAAGGFASFRGGPAGLFLGMPRLSRLR